MNGRKEPNPRVVIVGGGFGGLSAAKALSRAPFEATVIDRNNHHITFQRGSRLITGLHARQENMRGMPRNELRSMAS